MSQKLAAVQIATLAAIAQIGPSTCETLARHLGVKPRTLSWRLKTLYWKGYVERRKAILPGSWAYAWIVAERAAREFLLVPARPFDPPAPRAKPPRRPQIRGRMKMAMRALLAAQEPLSATKVATALFGVIGGVREIQWTLEALKKLRALGLVVWIDDKRGYGLWAAGSGCDRAPRERVRGRKWEAA